MPSEHINYERQGAIAYVTLNRPEKLNVLSRQMIESLTELFIQLKIDSDTRAVILTGAGEKAFCAGTDIAELAALTNATASKTTQRGQRLCDSIESCPRPVIAAINGMAAGGGFELALSCHLRIAAVNAEFSLPEAKLGIIPGYGGTQRLTKEIGAARARELMITGNNINAEQALRVGLINRIAAAKDLLNDAVSLANAIAQLAPLAIAACLQAVRDGRDLPLEKALALETELFASLFDSNDVREGTSAFLEKRTPSFQGN